jgi:hypothetical protein
MQRQSEADFAPSSVGSTLRLLSLLRTRITQQDGYETYISRLPFAYLCAHLGKAGLRNVNSLLDELSAKAKGKLDDDFTLVSEGLRWWREILPGLVGGDRNKERLVAAMPRLR